VDTGEERPVLAGIDVAALHMARVYGPDTSEATRRRWAARIRTWAVRYAGQITDYGREGRRRVYDLAELQQVATHVRADL
jgi:hypothetical protein